MRTPEFLEDNKLYAGDNTELSNKNANNMNVLRLDASGSASLLVHEQNTPDLTLYIEPGNNVYVNGNNFNFLGGDTPTFSVPSSGSRVDLVTLDDNGNIVIHENISGPSNYPATERALAEVLLNAGDTEITDDRITDVRQFFGAGTSSVSRVSTVKSGLQASDYPSNTQYTINTGSYTIGAGATEVYIDGTKKVLGVDYTEDSTTSIRLNEPLLDTQTIEIITNQTSGLNLSEKVSKSGDTMTGILVVPEIRFNSSNIKIYYSGDDLIFDDGNNTPKTLSDLITGGSSASVNHQEFTASSGQTLFSLSFTYTPGSYKLQVYVNGILQRLGVSYNETSSSSITFTSGLVAGSSVTFHAIV